MAAATGWKSGFMFRRIIRRGATRTKETCPKRFQPKFGGAEEKCGKTDYNVYRELFLDALSRASGGTLSRSEVAAVWGLHSGRVGFASTAASLGVPGWLRRSMAGWSQRSVGVSDQYIQALDKMGAVAGRMGL